MNYNYSKCNCKDKSITKLEIETMFTFQNMHAPISFEIQKIEGEEKRGNWIY